MEYTHCPNCNKKLKGLMSNTSILPQSVTDFINLFKQPGSESYCESCAPQLAEMYKRVILGDLKNIIGIIPILTSNNPKGWDYSSINMVSAQSVAGTGLFSEISSSWSDFIGSNSKTLSSKLAGGEAICRDQLRFNAALLGGNAVIATDIDYSEVGGSKNMLMVCMAGTAIKLKNINECLPDNLEKFNELENLILKLKLYHESGIERNSVI